MLPVEARGLVKRYGHVTAVAGVDLTVEPGDIYGYLGPNGAGKTTTLRMLLGLVHPNDGTVRLFGRDPVAHGGRALDGVAGFVEAPAFYPYLTGRKNLELLAALDRGGRAERAQTTSSSKRSVSWNAPATVSAATRKGCASGSESPPRSCAARDCSFSTSPRTASTRPASATCAVSSGGSLRRE
jgi:ABC-type sugar transport system ATPase subunit